jgi:carboxypeptidase D
VSITNVYRCLGLTLVAYAVDSLPDLDFDFGEMYAGQIAVNGTDLSRNMFYVFQPKIGDPVDEITIWFNGKEDMSLGDRT